jgi:disulfide bond formation protein DsbB
MRRILNYWLSIIFILSIIAIGSALIAEYFFYLAPCKMCLKQRYPYYLIISLTLVFYLFNRKKNILLFILIEIALLYGLFYAIWHVGIEQNILLGPDSCSGTLLKITSLQNLKEQINNQAVVSCSDIIWKIAGFSAATINSLLLLFLLIFNSIFIISNYHGSKKNT